MINALISHHQPLQDICNVWMPGRGSTEESRGPYRSSQAHTLGTPCDCLSCPSNSRQKQYLTRIRISSNTTGMPGMPGAISQAQLRTVHHLQTNTTLYRMRYTRYSTSVNASTAKVNRLPYNAWWWTVLTCPDQLCGHYHHLYHPAFPSLNTS